MTHDTAPDSEAITEAMMSAGLRALRGLDFKNPDYSNRHYTVRAIYEAMRGALQLK